jgi:NADPH:quinone reductase-like Zn-dependent oxidoreductase
MLCFAASSADGSPMMEMSMPPYTMTSHYCRCVSPSAFIISKPHAAAPEEMAKLVDAGSLRPIVRPEFALEDIRLTHALSESGYSVGKIALYVGRPRLGLLAESIV